MGSFERSYVPDEARRMKLPAGAFILADAEAMDDLAAKAGADAVLELRKVLISLDNPVSNEVIAKASIVVLQADPSNARSMKRIAELRAARPFMPLIVALRNADLATTRSLIREGVNDVVSIPFDFDQLCAALLDASAGAEKSASPDRPLSPLYAIVGSTGGCGATTVATHLAAEIAVQQGVSCGILDLDLQFGTVASYLGGHAGSSVQDLLEAGSRLDSDLIRSVAVVVRENVSVVPAPRYILPLEQVELDQVLRIVECARKTYRTVVLDLPTNFTNWSLSAILASSVLLMVVDLTVTSLRQARRRLDLLMEMGLDRSRVRAIVNRAERGFFKTINLDDAEKTLKVPVIATLANVPSLLASAQDQGVLANELQSRNPFSKDVARLVGALVKLDMGA